MKDLDHVEFIYVLKKILRWRVESSDVDPDPDPDSFGSVDPDPEV